MARNTIYIDLVVDDKGTTRKVAVDADKLSQSLTNTSAQAAQADRNIKGTAQASSNATKNFSKMSQGMGGLVGVYATLAAQVFALSAAYQFLLKAADTRILFEGQKALTEITGKGYASLAKSIQAATGAQLGYQQASQAAAIGTASGLGADMLKDLAKYSATISGVLGRDLEDTFNRLIRGITKAEPELLDELGIVLRLADASAEYSASIGKTANQLTAYERTQGVALFTLSQIETKFGALADRTELTQNGIRKLGVALSEVANKIMPAIASAAESVASVLTEKPGQALFTFGLLVTSVLSKVIPTSKQIAEKVDESLQHYENKIAKYTIKIDEFTRSQMSIPQKLKPALDAFDSYAQGLQASFQGTKTPQFVEQLQKLGKQPLVKPSQTQDLLSQIEKEQALRTAAKEPQQRDKAGKFLPKKKPLEEFKGISDEGLEEAKNKLLELEDAAKKAGEKTGSSFEKASGKIGNALNRAGRIGVLAMQKIASAAAKTAMAVSAVFSALGVISTVLLLVGMLDKLMSFVDEKIVQPSKSSDNIFFRIFGAALSILTEFWKVLQGVYSWIQSKLSDKTPPLFMGTGEEVSALTKQMEELALASKSVNKVLSNKKDYEGAISFFGSISQNLPIKELTNFSYTFGAFKEQLKISDDISKDLADNFKNIGRLDENLVRRPWYDFWSTGDASSKEIIENIGNIGTGYGGFDAIYNTINDFYTDINDISDERVVKLIEEREALEERQRILEESGKNLKEEIYNTIQLSSSYSKVIPSLNKYAEALRLAKIASQDISFFNDKFLSVSLMNILKAVEETAKAFLSTQASFNAYKEAYSSLKKEIISSSPINELQKQAVNISKILVPMYDFISTAKTIPDFKDLDLSTAIQQYQEFQSIFDSLASSIENGFEIDKITADLRGIDLALQNFANAPEEVKTPLLDLQALKNQELAVRNLQQELDALTVQEKLFDAFKINIAPEIQTAISGSVDATAFAAAGATTSQQLEETFVSGAKEFRNQFNSATDEFFAQWDKRNPNNANAGSTVPRSQEETSAGSNRIKEAIANFMREAKSFLGQDSLLLEYITPLLEFDPRSIEMPEQAARDAAAAQAETEARRKQEQDRRNLESKMAAQRIFGAASLEIDKIERNTTQAIKVLTDLQTQSDLMAQKAKITEGDTAILGQLEQYEKDRIARLQNTNQLRLEGQRQIVQENKLALEVAKKDKKISTEDVRAYEEAYNNSVTNLSLLETELRLQEAVAQVESTVTVNTARTAALRDQTASLETQLQIQKEQFSLTASYLQEELNAQYERESLAIRIAEQTANLNNLQGQGRIDAERALEVDKTRLAVMQELEAIFPKLIQRNIKLEEERLQFIGQVLDLTEKISTANATDLQAAQLKTSYLKAQTGLLIRQNDLEESSLQTQISNLRRLIDTQGEGPGRTARLRELELELSRLQVINRLEEQLKQLEEDDAARKARLKAIEQEYALRKSILDIQKELISLRNPYVQEELSQMAEIDNLKANISKTEAELQYLRGQEKITALENLTLDKVRLRVLEEQTTAAYKLGQTLKQSLGEGLQQEIANLLKGGELDIEQSFLTILESIGNALADQMSKMMTNAILDTVGLGPGSEMEKVRAEAEAYGKALGDEVNKVTNETADRSKELADAFASAAEVVATSFSDNATKLREELGAAFDSGAARLHESISSALSNSPLPASTADNVTPPVPQAAESIPLSMPSAAEIPKVEKEYPESACCSIDINTFNTAFDTQTTTFMDKLRIEFDQGAIKIGQALKNSGTSASTEQPGAITAPSTTSEQIRATEAVQQTAQETQTFGQKVGTTIESLGSDVREFGKDISSGFDKSFGSGIKAIFTADAPWIRGMVGGITGALATVVAGAFGGGGGSSKDSWRNAIIGGVISGAGMAFTSWLTAPAAPAAPAAPVQKANGGVLKGGFREFASGGIVNKPTLGLVGEGMYNEAVVPLPDGKSIPVIMKQEAAESIPTMIQPAGDRNNVSISVNVTNNGQTETQAKGSGDRGIEMAQAISAVVTQELKRQKRPGGLLSPYA